MFRMNLLQESLPCTVYRTFPLNDPRLGPMKLHVNHPAAAESVVGAARLRNSDTDIALQNLAKLNVSNKGECSGSMYICIMCLFFL